MPIAPKLEHHRPMISLSRLPEYRIWQAMNARCNNPNNKSYGNYGGRGILVAGEWMGPGGFTPFFEHVGPRPTPKHTLDRINNNLGYQPGNVRWATRHEQNRNKRGARLLTYSGKTMCMADWAIERGIPIATICGRLRRGFTVAQALSKDHLPSRRVGPKHPRTRDSTGKFLPYVFT